MRQLQYSKFRLLCSPAAELSSQRAGAQTVQRVVSASSHQDESPLQPHTEWGNLMADAVAQLQTSADSLQSFQVCSGASTDRHN